MSQTSALIRTFLKFRLLSSILLHMVNNSNDLLLGSLNEPNQVEDPRSNQQSESI